MKKLFLLLVVALVSTLSVTAQEDWKHEIGISYGPGAFTDLSSSYVGGATLGKQTSYVGAIGAEYFYRPKSPLGVGLVATFGTCKWSDSGNVRSSYISILPALKYNWLNREHYSMYSKLALGVIIGVNHGGEKGTTSAAFGWQASVVGAEFGGAFRGFIELGVGEQGLLVAGVKYKF
ncbi:MAG: hypothetical protein IJU62_03310 [Muribaculaceae bacterium]|nr:hypothetical protein [Muribaculaceae bacterium]